MRRNKILYILLSFLIIMPSTSYALEAISDKKEYNGSIYVSEPVIQIENINEPLVEPLEKNIDMVSVFLHDNIIVKENQFEKESSDKIENHDIDMADNLDKNNGEIEEKSISISRVVWIN